METTESWQKDSMGDFFSSAVTRLTIELNRATDSVRG